HTCHTPSPQPPHAPPHIHSFPTRRSSDLAGAFQIPVAARRRAGDVSVLRQGGKGGHQYDLHSQGPAAAGLREILRRGLGICYRLDRKSTRLNSSHVAISYAVFCLKKKKEW